MAKKVVHNGEKRRTDARVPQWIREAVDEDVRALGIGQRHHSGLKGVCSAGLLVYLALPVQVRRDFAALAREQDEDRAKRSTKDHWLIRSIRAAVSLGEGGVDRLEQLARMEAGQSNRTDNGNQADRDQEGKGKRRKPPKAG